MSPAFATWLQDQTGFAGLNATVLDVFVSRSDVTGESDLVIVFEEKGAARRFAFHIEDKVDAPLQPDQERRYRLRAQREIDRGDYQAFEVLLCAPAAYPVAHPQTEGFDRIISYEGIAGFLKEFDHSCRGQYRAKFIASAAMRNTNTWTRVSDDVTNAFWDAAYHIAISEFPILELKPFDLTKDLSWINIRSRDLPTKPQRIYVSLKRDRGYIDLTFTSSSVTLFSDAIASLLEPNMSVHQAGKSAVIRIQVAGFKPIELLEIGLSEIREAFVASAKLIVFYRSHRQHLDRAARAAAIL